jgi:hypothetical protein
MKKILITLSLCIGFSIITIAQHRFESGAPNFTQVVSLPYVYVDALRLQETKFALEIALENTTWKTKRQFITKQIRPNVFNEVATSENDPTTGELLWSKRANYSYKFGSTQQINEKQELKWESSVDNQFDEHNKFLYSYENGKLTQIEEQEFDSIDNVYRTESITKIFYDNQGRRIKDSVYVPFFADFYFLDIYQYNQFDECIANIGIVNNGSMRDTSIATYYTYDNGNISSYKIYLSFGAGLFLSEEMRYAYDEQNRLTSAAMFQLDAETGTKMVLFARYNQHYNQSGKLQALTKYMHSFSSNTLLPTDSIAMQYNTENKAVSAYAYTQSFTSPVWSNNPYGRYVFEQTATSVSEIPKRIEYTHVVPNPAVSEIQLPELDKNKRSSYTIIDITGKVWIQQQTTNEASISVDGLPNGIYFIEIEQDGSFKRVAKFTKVSQ